MGGSSAVAGPLEGQAVVGHYQSWYGAAVERGVERPGESRVASGFVRTPFDALERFVQPHLKNGGGVIGEEMVELGRTPGDG